MQRRRRKKKSDFCLKLSFFDDRKNCLKKTKKKYKLHVKETDLYYGDSSYHHETKTQFFGNFRFWSLPQISTYSCIVELAQINNNQKVVNRESYTV